ncbi:MAG: fibronectin type III domain-containing protein, partial [Candidatus Eisenbacteria bacterium]
MLVRYLSAPVRKTLRSGPGHPRQGCADRLTRSPGPVAPVPLLQGPRRHGPVFRGGLLAALLLVLLLGGCHKNESRPLVIRNTPPAVAGFFLLQDRAHAAEDLNLSITAVDEDGDELQYRWFASRGSFPFGRGQRSVVWRSPRTRGIDTITVVITDFQDTIRASKILPLVLPVAPGEPSQINSTDLLDLSWEKSPDEDVENWAGYEVYVAEHSLVGLSEEELTPYLATTQPVLPRVLRITGLIPGRRYYAHVRAARIYDGMTELSGPTREVDMSPRPEGPVSGFGEFTSPLRAAFDLSAGSLRVLDPADASGIGSRDFYLGTADPFDQGGDLMLKSVSELANRNEAWAARVVRFKELT